MLYLFLLVVQKEIRYNAGNYGHTLSVMYATVWPDIISKQIKHDTNNVNELKIILSTVNLQKPKIANHIFSLKMMQIFRLIHYYYTSMYL